MLRAENMVDRGIGRKLYRSISQLMSTIIFLLQFVVNYPCLAAAPREQNIAGKYMCVIAPDYWGWKMPQYGDHGQLTDGVTVGSWITPKGEFYALPSSVGWSQEMPVLLFDLGQIRPIGGIGLHTALSIWGPYWPEEIAVMVSDDGVNYYLAGPELQVKPEEFSPPLTKKQVNDADNRVPGSGGTTHWYRSCPYKTRGRYVGLIMSNSPGGAGAIDLDEVEIYLGPESGMTAPRSPQVFTEGECGRYSYKLYKAVNERLLRDIESLRTKIASSSIKDEERRGLLQRLDELDKQRVQMPVPFIKGFKAILPVNNLHKEIFKVHASLWRAEGMSGLCVWKSHRWDPLSPLEEPRGENLRFSIVMAQNSFCSDVINFSNSTNQPMNVKFSLKDFPVKQLGVFEIPLVDTAAFEPVASALVPVRPIAEEYSVDVQSGMTKQIWIRCLSKQLSAGKYEGKIHITTNAKQQSVPASVEVLGVSLPTSLSLSISGWDYPIQRSLEITNANVDQFVAVLKEYGVNGTWESGVFGVGTYDVNSNLITPPSRAEADQWLKYWPNAAVYACVAGELRNRNDKEIAAWAKDWSSYLQGKGVPPEKVMILIVDEPTSEAELKDILRVGRAIKRNSNFKIFNDIHYGDPVNAPPVINDVMREACDVQTFNVGFILDNPQIIKAFIQKHSRPGLEWWCYNGPIFNRLGDPYVAWLVRAWFCFDKGLSSATWWAFCDGGGGTSWNEYFNKRGPAYTPLYISPDSVTPGKSIEAMREGVQDYELLKMLKNKASQQNGGLLADAIQRVLSVGVSEVLASHTRDDYDWKRPKDRSVADKVRAEVLHFLENAEASPTVDHEYINLALNAKYNCVVKPNYWGDMSPWHPDIGQLTDGKIVQSWQVDGRSFSALPSSVGWSRSQGAAVLIDLGQIYTIGGIGIHTAISKNRALFPGNIAVLVSEDNVNFYPAATPFEVTPEQLEHPLREIDIESRTSGSTHWFRSYNINARGQYVSLVMSPFSDKIVLDEIEIYKGSSDAMTTFKSDKIFSGGQGAWESYKFHLAAMERISRDIESLKTKITSSSLSNEERQKLLGQLTVIKAKHSDFVPRTTDFNAKLPVNDLHKEVFQVQAALWRAQGMSGLRVWKSHRWDPLSPFEEPRGGQPKLNILMEQNSFRSDVLNLSNSASEPMKVSFALKSLPVEHLDVFEVSLVDTVVFEPVASALVPVQPKTGIYSVEIQPGMTLQIWVRCSSKDLKAGQYDGQVDIITTTEPGNVTHVNATIEVVPVRLPEQLSLLLGGWDYPSPGTYDVTNENLTEYVMMLQKYGVNMTWGAGVMPRGSYDADGNLTVPPSRDLMDQWLSLWPDARMYGVLDPQGSPRTAVEEKKIAEWVRDWSDYMESRGIPPEKVAILVQDEPRRANQLEEILLIGRIIRKGAPRFKIFNDINYDNPMEAPSVIDDVMREVCDMQCFHIANYLNYPLEHAEFMKKKSRSGLEWWCYTCNSTRLMDPYVSWLLQSWFCFAKGMTSAQFWAFGDGGGSSWCEYFNAYSSYTPLYLAKDSVTTSKSMEAIREGVQDYELLTMLKNKASRQSGGLLANAIQRVLSARVSEVLASHTNDNWPWKKPKDRSVADSVRAESLRLLERAGTMP